MFRSHSFGKSVERLLLKTARKRSRFEALSRSYGSQNPGRILSGIQPTGIPHVGNYLGALREWVMLQDSNPLEKNFYFLADLHALTVPQDPEILSANIYDMTASLLAIGLDPNRCTIFQQSQVSGHSELTWILMCYASMGQLNRMTQFKSKAETRGGQNAASAGLFSYPVLMAADVLLYKASGIPVGEDQLQHLELARDIAERFNYTHKCDLLKLPKPIISDTQTNRVMSLQDGTKKMSKSDPSEKSRILLTDTADVIKKKIKSASTDSLGPIDHSVLTNAERQNLRNLIGLYSAFTQQSMDDCVDELKGRNMATFKSSLTDVLIENICPVGEEIHRLQKDKTYLDNVLAQGSGHAQSISSKTIQEIQPYSDYNANMAPFERQTYPHKLLYCIGNNNSYVGSGAKAVSIHSNSYFFALVDLILCNLSLSNITIVKKCRTYYGVVEKMS